MKGNTNSTASGNGKVFSSVYTITPEKASQVVTPEYSEYIGPFQDEQTHDVSYDGLGNIKVRKVASWIDSEISADNIRTGHTILGVSGNVIELHGEEKTVKSTTSTQTITPSSDKNGITKITVNPVVYQSKSTNPRMTSQTVYADGGYDALSSVTVNAIDLEYLKEQEPDLLPQNIKKGVDIFNVVGTYDPQYTSQAKTVNPTRYIQTISPDSGYDGLSRVTVNAIDMDYIKSTEPDLVAGNIKKNVDIFGVVGTYEGRQPVITTINETSTINPTISQQNFNVPSGYDGYSSFKVNPVTSNIDANILPKNIKRNVEILGVMGTYTTENLQEKVATPTKQQQVITYDDDVYEGLKQVTITGVTSAIDENIKAENIKKDVEILGVTGSYEETFTTEEKIVTPTKIAQTVTPSTGYDGLSKVSVEGVTSAIDANILAENIKKGIEILGVTGSLESASYNFQSNKEVTPTVAEQNIKPDLGYDALLNVIVKAVTASIDPNILPKNIKKDIQILGVVGTLIEGEEQQYFDFRNISDYYANGGHHFGGGGEDEITNIMVEDTDYSLSTLSYNIPAVKDVTAVLFSIVTGYDDIESTDPTLYQTYIYFTGGKYWDTSYNLTMIKDQIRYIYPYINDYNVDGCLLNCDDVANEHTYKLYVLINSEDNTNAPVLVDGTFDDTMYPIKEKIMGTVYGTPTITKDYVINNLNINNYIKLPKEFCSALSSGSTWEWVFKFSPKVSSFGYAQALYAQGVAYENRLDLNESLQLRLSISNSTSGYDIGSITGTTTLTAGNTYWVKAEFTGAAYNLYLSTDGETWSLENTLTSSTSIVARSDDWRIGVNVNGTAQYQYPFEGKIYLKDSYIKINDNVWWKGVDTVQLFNTNRYVSEITIPTHNRFEPKLHEKDNNVLTSWVLRDRKGVTNIVTPHTDRPLTIDVSAFDKNYGEEEIPVTDPVYIQKDTNKELLKNLTINKDTNIVSGFSSNDYIISDKSFYIGHSTWEIGVRFKSTTTTERRLCCLGISKVSFVMGFSGSYILFWLSTNGTSWNLLGGTTISSFSTNTWYNVKFLYDGSYYRVYTSTNNGYTWTQNTSWGSYTTSFVGGGSFSAQPRFGTGDGSNYTEGSLDLTGCYLKIAGQTVYTPKYTYYDTARTNHNIIPLTEDLLFYRREDELTEEYGTRGNLVNYLDYGNAVTMPLYTVTQDDEQVYIFSPDDTFIDGETYKDGMFVDNIDIPEHTPYLWNTTTKSFDVKKIITVNIVDEDARLYTTTEEGE